MKTYFQKVRWVRLMALTILVLIYDANILFAQTATVSTFAGSGVAGSADGTGSFATFTFPYGIAVDASGSIYIGDTGNSKIRKITSTGVVSTFTGTGTGSSVDGISSVASFSSPMGLAINASGYIYVTDYNSHKIRKITPSGVVSTLAGTGVLGSSDGIGTSASFSNPRGVAVDASGNVYVADSGNNKIRKITPTGVVSTLAGTGASGSTDGIGTSASFSQPAGLAVDASGNIYVADNSKIRKITSVGMVSTIAGGSSGNIDGTVISARFNGTAALVLDTYGNIYVVDRGNHKIRMITPAGIVSTLAGTGTRGSADGIGSSATFNLPMGIGIDASGNLYVGDQINNKIRKITFCNAPNITTQPIIQTACSSNQASFSVSSTGDGLTYQWKKETTNILGATSSSLLLSNVSATDAGNYSCTVTGTCGTVTSNAATLTVQTTLAPTTTPQSLCSSPTPTVAQLTATGTAIKWYAISSGGTALASNTILTSGTYYASQTVNACEGPRASASVTINASPNNAINFSAPTTACPQEMVVFAVTNATAGAQYNWSLPTSTIIISGANTAQLTVKWSGATGVVSVTETNGCGTGLSSAKQVTTNSNYVLSKVDAVCGSSFCLPLQTTANIKSGLIALDFTVYYDPALVTPTGSASLGTLATSYSAYSLNTTISGQVIVSISLQNAPSNIFFSGTGNIICLNFNLKAGVNSGATGTLTTSLIEESSVIGTTMSCNASSAALNVIGIVGAKIIYRDDVNNNLGYDAASPSLYTPTTVAGYGSACGVQVGTSVKPDNTGLFSYYLGNGSTIKIERDIKGNVNVPTIECANVQAVINNADYQLTVAIANSTNTTPTLYDLLAADVNMDGKVTSGDASLISSRSINQYNCEFPQATNYEWSGTNFVPKPTYSKSVDWLFVPDVYLSSPSFLAGMGRNKVPKLPTCLPSPPGVASCSSAVNTTYHAVLIGDVNANWTKAANGSQSRESIVKEIFFDLSNAIVNGSFKTIPVYYSAEPSFSGIDFSIDYKSTVSIHNITGADGVAVQWNNIGNQRLMVSAYANGTLSSKYPVLYLTVTAQDALTPESFSAGAGYLNGEEAKMRFDESKAEHTSTDLQAEIFPNPSNGITYLYTTSTDSFVKLSIYHTNGTLVYENASVTTNENTPLPELKAGVYLLKVSGSSGETAKKWVRY